MPVIYLCLVNNPHLLVTGLEHYLSFVILLGALFIVSGGVCITGDLVSTPLANTLILGLGAALANLIGTTSQHGPDRDQCRGCFLRAMTYIGNAPNFMARSIAAYRGWKMPNFFVYMLWSAGILLPLFLLITFIFFR